MLPLFLMICAMTTDPVRQVDYLRFDPMVDKLGLAQHSVRSFLQDSEGYLWLGTYEGLHRLDGYEVTIFTPGSSDNPIGDDRVPSLFQDSSGQIWAGTATKGLWYLLGNGRGFARVPGIDGCVRHLQSTQAGDLLVGGCEGLFIVADFQIQHRLFEKQIITALTPGQDQVFWVAVGKELYELDSRSLKQSHRDSFPDILALNLVAEQELWLGTAQGLTCLNLETNQRRKFVFSTDRKPAAVVDIFKDSSQNLWLSTKGAGILVQRAKQEGFDQFRGNPRDVLGLGDEFIDFVREDTFGNLWLASSSSGVFQRIAPDGLDMYYFRDVEAPKNGVHCFEKVGDSIWVGTQKGLWTLKEDRYQLMDLGIEKQPIRDIQNTGDQIWVATGTGAYLLDPSGRLQRRFSHSETVGSLSHNLVRVVFQDTNGDIWLGTRDGLNLYQPDHANFQVFSQTEGLTNSSVLALFQGDDSLWIGTYAGLFHMNLPSRKIEPIPLDQLLESSVTVINCMKDGTLWIGTHGNGLFRKGQRGEVQRWQRDDGLGSNVVYGIEFDQAGTAWISTNQGIVSINPRGDINAFDDSNGLQGKEFNFGAYFQDTMGNLYFGGLHGLNRFYPDHFQPIQKPPMARITQVDLLQSDGNFQPLQADEISLDHRDFKGLRISFSSFQFFQPTKAQFAYRFNQSDPWTQVGNSRQVLLTAIDPGEYQFQAKASDSRGQWSKSARRVQLKLRPPFYKTLVFQITTLIALVLLANLSYLLIRRLIRLIAHWKKTSFVGPYKIIEKIGTGGMSDVYRAKNVHSQQIVALKVLHKNMSEIARKRFFREGLICETLSHPNIVKVLAKGEHNAHCYLALEFIPGNTLSHFFEACRPSIQFTVSLFKCLVEILKEMHQQGVVHRDLKPDNIMMEGNLKWGPGDAASLRAHIRILDFGISKLVEDTYTQTSYFMGTLMYLPPEILLNSDQGATVNYDFYSLGMTIHELITSQRPFSGEHAFEVIGQILNTELEDLHRFNPEIPAEFAKLIADVTAKDTTLRLVDATMILARLAEIPEDFFEKTTPLRPTGTIADTLVDQKRLFSEYEHLIDMDGPQQQAYLAELSRTKPLLAKELRELMTIPSAALDEVFKATIKH